jgi:predicted ATP-grasp superfamily ATP-dependent carboligase
VHALEARRFLPGVRTRYAHVAWCESINDERLVPALHTLRESLGGDPPVLFPTNDNVVRILAENWPELATHYRLSWGDCAGTVLSLLTKSRLHDRCDEIGALYPRTRILDGLDELEGAIEVIEFPLIVKPARPLSAFKVKIVEDAGSLRALVQRHESQLPFLLQQWIPGADRRLRFCALYLDRGRVLARFDGRKLRSQPPARGQTTAADSYVDDRLYAESLRFFEGLGLSGPVSLEVKVGPDDRQWVIEPTIGRTDYWLDCCVVNGVNLPYLEYRHQLGHRLRRLRQTSAGIWMDTERDLPVLGHNLPDLLRALSSGQRIAFPYLACDDLPPFFASWPILVRRMGGRLVRRISRLVGRGA